MCEMCHTLAILIPAIHILRKWEFSAQNTFTSLAAAAVREGWMGEGNTEGEGVGTVLRIASSEQTQK